MKKIFLKALSIKIQNLGLLLFMLVIMLFPYQNAKAVAPMVCPPPQVTIMAVPPTINAGASSTLYWSSTGTTSCKADTPSNWTRKITTNDNQSVSPGITTSYKLTCTDVITGGTSPASATVTVTGSATAPAVTTGNSTVSGTSATLSGNVMNHGTVVGGATAAISQKGFYYWLTSGTNHNVTTIIDSSTVDNIGATKSLSVGTYSWQAFVKNSAGLTAIGSIEDFTITASVAACPAVSPVTGCAGVWVADLWDGSTAGNKKCVPAGEYSNVSLFGFNTNEISYIKVEPGYVADIYTGTGFTNSSDPFSTVMGTISNTIPGILKAGANNIGDYTSPDGYNAWNDSIKSMKVTQTGLCDLVTFYQDANLKGMRESFGPGDYPNADSGPVGVISGPGDYPNADSGRVGGISSALISPGVSFEVFDGPNFWSNYHIEPAQSVEHSINFHNFENNVGSFKIRVGNSLQ